MSVSSLVTSGPLLLAAPVALAAGALSFLSPCVLPLVPGYLSYVTGMSGADLAGTTDRAPGAVSAPGGGGVAVMERVEPATVAHGRSRVILGALLFVLGFSAVFVGEGALFGTLGATLRTHERDLEVVFGAVTIVLGLAFAGAFARLPIAQRELRIHASPGVGLVAAPVLGVLFGLGWTPCIGPTLGAVLGLSTQNSTAGRGAILTLVYCLGLGIPFLLVAVAFRRALGAFAVIKRHYATVMLVGGGLLVLVGLAEVSGAWAHIVADLQNALGGGTTSPL